MAIALIISAKLTVTFSLEVSILNISSASITPEPTQEINNLSFTSQASDATKLGSDPSKVDCLPRLLLSRQGVQPHIQRMHCEHRPIHPPLHAPLIKKQNSLLDLRFLMFVNSQAIIANLKLITFQHKQLAYFAI